MKFFLPGDKVARLQAAWSSSCTKTRLPYGTSSFLAVLFGLLHYWNLEFLKIDGLAHDVSMFHLILVSALTAGNWSTTQSFSRHYNL